MLLSDFQIIRPPYETPQEECLKWLAKAHGVNGNDISEKLWNVGCKPEHIQKRGHVIDDYLHTDWEKMEIYRLDEQPTGKDLSVRSKVYSIHTDKVFEDYYAGEDSPPDDLIHVSCTGYVSPSGAQKIVSKKDWGKNTTVTHTYHMGCYASIPAIRMAGGFLASSPEKKRADIVHTEICSLHVNPANHNLDQLVSQSLFADGFIKYSIQRKTDKPHFRVLASAEEIIPNSIKSMSWNVMNWGFEMTLQKEVPVLIARAILPFVEGLTSKANICLENALFAVHPGGPKILFYVQKALGLSDDQMKYSYEILKNYGNMSSATLPHIWERILQEKGTPKGTKIISLAFGPGLSIAGAIMEKG